MKKIKEIAQSPGQRLALFSKSASLCLFAAFFAA